MRYVANQSCLRTARKGTVLAAMAVETHGKGTVLAAKAVETHKATAVRPWKHKAKARVPVDQVVQQQVNDPLVPELLVQLEHHLRPDLEVRKTPKQHISLVFCMSWCANLEFRGRRTIGSVLSSDFWPADAKLAMKPCAVLLLMT